MTNTDKLLRAFIEASGYEIEEIGGGVSPARRRELEDNNALFTFAVEDVIDYKVTKVDDYVPLPVQSKEWGCIVDYLTSHYEDIEIGINDFATLRPIMDFISRKS